jgi:spore coat protein SA
MRIAFVSQPSDRMDQPVQSSSIGIWTNQVAKRFAGHGHSAVIFANHGPKWTSSVARNENVEYVYSPTGVNRLTNKAVGAWSKVSAALAGNSQSGLPRFARAWQDRFYASEVGRSSRKLECDVVHVMNYSQFIPVIGKLHPTSKLCLHMHCEWLNQLDPAPIRKRLARADLIIGCSEYITGRIVKRFPEFADRCVTVHNGAGAGPEYDRNTVEPGVVLFVGRVSPEKGLHDLIQAFKIVLKRFPEARLHIVGGAGSTPMELLVGLSDEPYVKNLRVFYERQGGRDPYALFLEREAGGELGRRIFFDGRIPNDQVEAFYRRAAILVNPSLSESFGMSLVEAMMHRVPVIATRVGGMTTIVDHGRTGLLVDPAHPRSLADGIGDLLGDPGRALKMGDAGRREAIRKFSWEKVTGDLLGHFKTLVDEGVKKN